MDTKEKYKGHEKDTKNNEKTPEKIGSNTTFDFLIKKTEKITTALYIITDFFDDREILKWELRNTAVMFFSLVHTLGGRLRSPAGAPSPSEVCTAIEEMIVLLDIAAQARLISAMNFTILERELLNLNDSIQAHARYSGFSKEAKLSTGALQSMRSTRPVEATQDIKDKDIKDTQQYKGQRYKKQDTRKGQQVSVTSNHDKQARRDAILQFLNSNGHSSIKDILKVIPDASEKTVQRELKTLIQKGIVRKEGERRWSVYSLTARQA